MINCFNLNSSDVIVGKRERKWELVSSIFHLLLVPTDTQHYKKITDRRLMIPEGIIYAFGIHLKKSAWNQITKSQHAYQSKIKNFRWKIAVLVSFFWSFSSRTEDRILTVLEGPIHRLSPRHSLYMIYPRTDETRMSTSIAIHKPMSAQSYKVPSQVGLKLLPPNCIQLHANLQIFIQCTEGGEKGKSIWKTEGAMPLNTLQEIRKGEIKRHPVIPILISP